MRPPRTIMCSGAEAAGDAAAEAGAGAGRRAAPEHDGPFPIISMDVPRNRRLHLEGPGREGIGGPREAEAAYAQRGEGQRPVGSERSGGEGVAPADVSHLVGMSPPGILARMTEPA